MSSTDRLRDRIGHAQKPAGGNVGRTIVKALRKSPEKLASNPSEPTNTEQLIAAAGTITALNNDSNAQRKIVKAQAKLVKSAAAAHVAAADYQRIKAADVDRRRLRGIFERDARQAETLAAPIDHARALVSRWVVIVAEVVLGLVESGFWYLVFSADIDRRVSLLSTERIAAIGLALFIPILGILAARLAGPTWQRVLRYPANKPHLRRNQIIAAAVSAGLLTAAGIAAWFLVSWRYSSNNPTNALAVTPPAWAMSLLFVGSLITLALLRAFGESEQHETNKRRDADVDAATRAVKSAHDTMANALTGWTVAWTELRQLLNVGLNQIEQVYATGQYLLLAHRGAIADSPRTRPLTRTTNSEGTSNNDPQYHLDVALFTPQQLRVHHSGVQTLIDYRPPALQPSTTTLSDFPAAAALEADTMNSQVRAVLGELTAPTLDDTKTTAKDTAASSNDDMKSTGTVEGAAVPSNDVENSTGTVDDAAVPNNNLPNRAGRPDDTSRLTVLDTITPEVINGHDHRSSSSA